MPHQNSHPSTLASLRAAIARFQGYQCTQGDLAKRAGCARITIQTIERGKLALSEKLARRISEATGAGVNWLLRGKPSAGPLDAHGRKITREMWLAHKADLETGKHARMRLMVNVSAFIPPLAAVAHAAAETGRLDVFLQDLNEAANLLRKRYGEKEGVMQDAAKMVKAGQMVGVAEEDFGKVSDKNRVVKYHAKGFDEIPMSRVAPPGLLSSPQIYAVWAEVLPAATSDEIKKLHPLLAAGEEVEMETTEHRDDAGNVKKTTRFVPKKKPARKKTKRA